MEYHTKVKDVLYYLQEKVLGFSDHTLKYSSMYGNITSAVDHYLADLERPFIFYTSISWLSLIIPSLYFKLDCLSNTATLLKNILC